MNRNGFFANSELKRNASRIIDTALHAAMPDTAVRQALMHYTACEGRLILVAVGKAAWRMANTVHGVMGDLIDSGIVITKHGHSEGAIGNLVIREAGHPVPDADTYAATKEALDMTANLTQNDCVLFLLSGGGSALFEQPLLEESETADITRQLLACGADIVEVNTIRKRLSGVKGGRFALHVSPARIFSIVLSDVLGDAPDMIASGPAYPDRSTCADALLIAKKYALTLSDRAWELLKRETPKDLPNVETHITGSVSILCEAAADVCDLLGFEPFILTDRLCAEAREAGSLLASVAQHHVGKGKRAFIMGGETVVHLTGNGLGGRNQELAFAAAKGIAGLNAVIFSLGSDGTDGPTDAAGGIVDGETYGKLSAQGIDHADVLARNDAYRALRAVDGLIVTGPTGTNVNDLTVLLIEE